MIRKAFHPSLSFLVPCILAGISVMALLITDRILDSYQQDMGAFSRLAWLCAASAAAVLGSSLAMLRLILSPIWRFMSKAESSPLLRGPEHGEQIDKPASELERFDLVFNQVSQALGKIEAKDLFPEIVGDSLAIRGVLSHILKVAPSEATVLICGESGTGKELAALAVHRHSPRKDKPFVALNCSAIPESLLESELFGHEKGSFTGALARKRGKFELAGEGTIFLDEIGDMPLSTQAKILRALQNREFERVGGDKSLSFSARIIAASNRDLPKMIIDEQFREDLYHRLNVFPLNLPPLRERLSDVPALAALFLSSHPGNPTLSPEALRLLMAYSWPGNVRELQNAMQRAALMAEDGLIKPEHLPQNIKGMSLGAPFAEGLNGLDLDSRLEAQEKALLLYALSHSSGVQKEAARLLGIKERSLWHRVKKFGINVEDFKKK